MGAPIGDQSVDKDDITQRFTGGQITWNSKTNTFTTQPANLASALSGLQIPGQKTAAGPASKGGVHASAWHWWWLLAGIAALLLIALVVPSARSWRRRRAAKRVGKRGGADSRDEPATESVAQWSPEADRDLATSSLNDDHRPPRPRTVRLPSQPVSAWMPPDRTDLIDEPPDEEVESPEEFSDFAEVDEDVDDHFDESFDEDPDDVDTDPTGFPAQSEVRGGRHAASDGSDDDSAVTTAVPTARIPTGQLAIHLPMDDPYQVPEGYPVKANASSGLYYMPDSVLYEETMAEIWFASEDIAQANGFHKAG